MQGIQELDGLSLIRPEAIDAYARAMEGESTKDVGTEQVMEAIDCFEARFSRGDRPGDVFDDLLDYLHVLRSSMPLSNWRALAPAVTAHPISRFLLQDPFTEWSHLKPRGYSGDASLLDFVYGHEASFDRVEAASPLGRDIYEQTRHVPSCVAVRERRAIVADHVDTIALARKGDAEVMAIAAGHLREAELSFALAEGRLKRWVALDQDPASITEINSAGSPVVEAVPGSVRDIIGRHHRFGKFDLVYSAGLYDYLEHNVAVRMTSKCLEMLKPGGSYLFANFADGIREAGYMQTFMRWELILRTSEDMQRIINESAGAGYSYEIMSGVHDAIIYARITKD